MIETIPNPLTDAGVKRDIKEKVEKLMNEQGRFRNVSDHIEYLVKSAAEWGMSEGFRMGWKLHEIEVVQRKRLGY